MLGQAGDALGVTPGAEFRAAVAEAREIGAKVVLGDRPVSVTLARTWAALGPWARVRFLWELLVTGFTVDKGALDDALESFKAGGGMWWREGRGGAGGPPATPPAQPPATARPSRPPRAQCPFHRTRTR